MLLTPIVLSQLVENILIHSPYSQQMQKGVPGVFAQTVIGNTPIACNAWTNVIPTMLLGSSARAAPANRTLLKIATLNQVRFIVHLALSFT